MAARERLTGEKGGGGSEEGDLLRGGGLVGTISLLQTKYHHKSGKYSLEKNMVEAVVYCGSSRLKGG